MSTNSISTPNVTSYQTFASNSASSTKKEASKTASKSEEKAENEAAIYESNKTNEPNNSTKKIYKKDTETITRMLNDLEERKQQLKDLVKRTFEKQGKTFDASDTIWEALKSGKLEFSKEEIKQAKEDVSEDGYWGVKQTSERLFSFAYALAGGDSSKADTLMKAIEKGYEQATKDWDDDLPDICKQTLEATKEKMDAWKNETKETLKVQ